jgi:hypothetical protein
MLDRLAPLAHLLRMLLEPACTASRMCSCSQRVICRSLAVVQMCLMGQLGQALVQERRRTNPFSSLV